MVFDTNSTSWTNVIRPTLDEETTYVSNITRAAIIIGTATFALVLIVIALLSHFLRKWNQRNYTKVYENVELEDQRIGPTQGLPSILKKRYPSDGGPLTGTKRSGRGAGVQTEVLFKDEDDSYSDDDGSSDGEGSEYEDEHYQGGQKVSLLSQSQPNPRSRSPLNQGQQQQQRIAPPPSPQREQRRVRIQESVEEEEEDDESEYEDEEDDDDDGSAVIVRIAPDRGEREE
jgi:hypothetical protein